MIADPVDTLAPKEHGASRGSLAMLLSFAVTSVFAYAYAVVLTWLLPVAEYGVVGVLQAVLLIGYTAVNSGVPWSVAHRMSRRTQEPVGRAYVLAAAFGNAVLGACLGAVILVVMERRHGGLGQQSAGVTAVVAGTMVLFAVTAVLTSILQGALRLGWFGAVRAIEAIVRFVAAVVLVKLGMGILGALAGFLIGAAVALVASLIGTRGLPIARSAGRVADLASEYKSVVSFFVVMVSLAGLTYADLIGVKALSPASSSAVSAGHYQVAVALSRIPVLLTLAVFTAIYPYAAREFSHQMSDIGYARLSVKFLVLFLVPIALVMAMMSGQVIAFFFPESYAASAQALEISGFAVIALCGVYAWSLLLQASGQLWIAAVVLPVALMGEVGALALLVPTRGTSGAAFALGSCAIVALGALMVLGRSTLRIAVSAWEAARYLVCVGVLAVALYICPHAGRFVTAAWAAGGLIVYLALLAGTRLLSRTDASTLLGGIIPRGGATTATSESAKLNDDRSRLALAESLANGGQHGDPSARDAGDIGVPCRYSSGDPGAAPGKRGTTLHSQRSGRPRILHLAYEDHAKAGAGGGSTRTREINERLANRFEITAVCARYRGARARTENDVRYRFIGLPLGFLSHRVAYFLCLPYALYRYRSDLVVEEFSAPLSSVGVPYMTNRPVIGSVQWLFAKQMTRLYKLPFDRVERFGLASHRELIAVSSDLAAELRVRNPRACVYVVPNGVESPPAVTGSPRRDMLFVGRLDIAQKGLDLLIEAYVSIAPKISQNLVIAGDGPDAVRLQRQAQQLGVSERVVFVGWLPKDQLWTYMASAEFVVMPSRYESFGMVAAEALSVATPVVASDIPCLREVVTEENGLLVPEGDVAALAAAMLRLSNDPRLRQELGSKGRESVRHLSWDSLAEVQAEVYDQVLARHRRRADGPSRHGR